MVVKQSELSPYLPINTVLNGLPIAFSLSTAATISSLSKQDADKVKVVATGSYIPYGNVKVRGATWIVNIGDGPYQQIRGTVLDSPTVLSWTDLVVNFYGLITQDGLTIKKHYPVDMSTHLGADGTAPPPLVDVVINGQTIKFTLDTAGLFSNLNTATAKALNVFPVPETIEGAPQTAENLTNRALIPVTVNQGAQQWLHCTVADKYNTLAWKDATANFDVVIIPDGVSLVAKGQGNKKIDDAIKAEGSATSGGSLLSSNTLFTGSNGMGILLIILVLVVLYLTVKSFNLK